MSKKEICLREFMRRVEGQRLVYYAKKPDPNFWERHWRHSLTPVTYARSSQGFLGDFADIFLRWLPKNEPLLEAGCGLGQLVLSLSVRGYRIQGVEWADGVVKLVKREKPDLSI